MFEHLKRCAKILVTGPQRSGTTICAKMVAADTGHRFLSEGHLEGGDPRRRLRKLLQDENIVVQCPSLSRWVHEYEGDDVLIVFMRRDAADIVASERRVGWSPRWQLEFYGAADGEIISEVKRRFWEEEQKPGIRHWLEVEFESLAGHPLWVPKERRAGFGPRQISEDSRFRGEIFLND